MKRIQYFGAFLIMACLVFSCGETKPDVKLPAPLEVPEVNPDTSGGKSTADFEAHVKARIEKGDTIAIAHEKLQNMLIDSIAGYQLEINKASTFETRLFTFSEASKVFYNDEEQYIELTAGDYVANPDFFRVNLQRYNLAQGVEISGMEDRKVADAGFAPNQAKDFFAWSAYNSRKRQAWIYIGIDERYFVTIEATDQADFLDIEKVKSWLNWNALY